MTHDYQISWDFREWDETPFKGRLTARHDPVREWVYVAINGDEVFGFKVGPVPVGSTIRIPIVEVGN